MKVILSDGQKCQKVEKVFVALVRVREEPERKSQHYKSERELKSQRMLKELRH